MKARSVVLMGAAVVCGLLAAVLTARILTPPKGQVLVAQKPIPRGAELTDVETMFTLADIPANVQLPIHAVTSFDEIREKGKDRLIKNAMAAGEALSLENLIDRKASVTASLRPGFLAFTVKATELNSIGGNLQADNFVKVFSRRPHSGERGVLLMKNIRVVAVDAHQGGTDKPGQVPHTITLEVTDDEAMKLKQVQDENQSLSLGLIALADEKNLTDRSGEGPTSEPAITIINGGRVLKSARPQLAHRED